MPLVPMTPDNITSNHIQTMGRLYLEKHGDQPGFFHTHQLLAKRLRECPNDSTASEKWHFLASIYGQLTNHNGGIARSIQALFQTAFGAGLDKGLSMREAEWALNSQVTTYFLKQQVVYGGVAASP
ncbi:MAG: hypothetical protein ACYC0J_02825 [Gammaproteobacteria bacterium]